MARLKKVHGDPDCQSGLRSGNSAPMMTIKNFITLTLLLQMYTMYATHVFNGA